LYRHFPHRDALLEAVYSAEVEKLAAALSAEFAHTMPSYWNNCEPMLLFVDYIATTTHQLLHEYAGGGPAKCMKLSRAQIYRSDANATRGRAIKNVESAETSTHSIYCGPLTRLQCFVRTGRRAKRQEPRGYP